MYVRMCIQFIHKYMCMYSMYFGTGTHTHTHTHTETAVHIRMCVLWLKLILLHLKVVGVAKLPQHPPCGFVSPSLDEELVEEEETWQRGRGRGGEGRGEREGRRRREGEEEERTRGGASHAIHDATQDVSRLQLALCLRIKVPGYGSIQRCAAYGRWWGMAPPYSQNGSMAVMKVPSATPTFHSKPLLLDPTCCVPCHQ